MKRSEMKPCSLCGGPVQPAFAEVVVRRHVVDAAAVQRYVGLTQMFNGNAMLANVMGPDEQMTEMTSEKTLIVCMKCLADPDNHLGIVVEHGDREE